MITSRSHKHKLFSFTLAALQYSGSANQVSSTMVSGVRGIPLKATDAIDEVRTTLLTEGVFKQVLGTLIVPLPLDQVTQPT